jgi:hypothetical protein
LIGAGLLIACGPHRVAYVNPSLEGKQTMRRTEQHAHGVGPLLIGGGGYFGLVNEISPALIDYTGEVSVSSMCPKGFARVSHYHTFGQSAGAGFLSWLVMVNAYHPSTVDWDCVVE